MTRSHLAPCESGRTQLWWQQLRRWMVWELVGNRRPLEVGKSWRRAREGSIQEVQRIQPAVGCGRKMMMACPPVMGCWLAKQSPAPKGSGTAASLGALVSVQPQGCPIQVPEGAGRWRQAGEGGV